MGRGRHRAGDRCPSGALWARGSQWRQRVAASRELRGPFLLTPSVSTPVGANSFPTSQSGKLRHGKTSEKPESWVLKAEGRESTVLGPGAAKSTPFLWRVEVFPVGFLEEGAPGWP